MMDGGAPFDHPKISPGPYGAVTPSGEENEAGQRNTCGPALKKGTRDRSTQLLVVGLLLAVIGSYLVAYIYG